MGIQRVEFFTLGAIELRVHDGEDSRTLDIAPKYRALLAYLALRHPRQGFHARDVLAGLFWPEHDQEHARSNLRKAVYELRRHVGPDSLVTRGKEDIAVDRTRVWCDAVELDELLDRNAVEAVLDLYRGELLPGMHLAESAEFERWLEDQRLGIRNRILKAIRARAADAEASGAVAEATRWHRRALEVDPYDEETVRKLMDARAQLGDRTGAVRVYEAFVRRLSEELDLEPTEATREVAAKVRTRPATRTPQEAGGSEHLRRRDPDATTGIRSFVPRLSIPVPLAAVAALAILAGFVGLYAIFQNRGRNPTESEAIAGKAATGIAVVPFHVTDPSLEMWSEGMVDLLSTNLDGASGLRAIDSRTMLARWREGVPGGVAPDLAAVLEVARRTGAEYAVVGSAVSLGSDVRLSADVYELARGSPIGDTQVEGSPDSVFALVDQLSIGVLGTVIDKGGQMTGPRLSSMTTSSLTAIKAFLEGERFYRRSEFQQAATAYEQAIEADSSFALAWYGLARAFSWSGGDEGAAIDQALRFVERLPLREATLVRAQHALMRGSPFRALEIAREAVSKYPDDSSAWYILGDVHFHFGGSLLAVPSEAQKALARAVQLEPRFAPYRIHLVDHAFLDADGATAADQMSTYASLAPGDVPTTTGHRLGYALAFGDSMVRAKAWASMDTIETLSLQSAHLVLLHPRFLSRRERVLRQALARPDLNIRPWTAGELARTLELQGKVRATFDQLRDSMATPGLRAYMVYRFITMGVEVPADLRRALDLKLALREPPYSPVFYAAAHAVDQGRWAEHALAVDSLRAIARRISPRDSILARITNGQAEALEGYSLWRRGRPHQGLPLLDSARHRCVGRGGGARGSNLVIRWWTGMLLWELDRKEEAIRYFESLANYGFGDRSIDSSAAWELGRMYEELGETRKAIDTYDRAITAWQDADPEIQPRITAAKQAVARLSHAAD